MRLLSSELRLNTPWLFDQHNTGSTSHSPVHSPFSSTIGDSQAMSLSMKALLMESLALVIAAIMTSPVLLFLDWLLNQ